MNPKYLDLQSSKKPILILIEENKKFKPDKLQINNFTIFSETLVKELIIGLLI